MNDSCLRGFVIRAYNKVAHGLQTRASGGDSGVASPFVFG
jgi:hypothetical protein